MLIRFATQAYATDIQLKPDLGTESLLLRIAQPLLMPLREITRLTIHSKARGTRVSSRFLRSCTYGSRFTQPAAAICVPGAAPGAGGAAGAPAAAVALVCGVHRGAADAGMPLMADDVLEMICLQGSRTKTVRSQHRRRRALCGNL